MGILQDEKAPPNDSIAVKEDEPRFAGLQSADPQVQVMHTSFEAEEEALATQAASGELTPLAKLQAAHGEIDGTVRCSPTLLPSPGSYPAVCFSERRSCCWPFTAHEY